jgi:hypothetical protein
VNAKKRKLEGGRAERVKVGVTGCGCAGFEILGGSAPHGPRAGVAPHTPLGVAGASEASECQKAQVTGGASGASEGVNKKSKLQGASEVKKRKRAKRVKAKKRKLRGARAKRVKGISQKEQVAEGGASGSVRKKCVGTVARRVQKYFITFDSVNLKKK